MDSLTLILKYIFEKNKFDADLKSVESLFEDGLLFPSFISMIFNVKEIPDINKSPKTDSDIKSNNDIALQFLFQNNDLIDKIYMKYQSKEDQMNLISEILKKQCFDLNHQRIIDKCNLIVQPLNVHYTSEKNFIDILNLFTILSVLTDGKVQNISERTKDIDVLLTKSFQIANIPLFIDSTTLTKQTQYLFFIQVEVILQIFEDRKSIQKVSSNDLFEEPEKKKKKKSRFLGFFRKKGGDDDSLFSESSSEYYSDDGDDKENEDIQNEALLNTINCIGSKYRISFQNFDEAVKNDAIPKFVISFLNLQSIPNVEIKNTPRAKSGSERLTKEQIDNIKAVIEFIKNEKKIKKFKVLLFDFDDLKSVESSTILFYENFLNCFFIKKLKQEMYLRIVKLLCTHTSRFNEKYNERLFTKYKIYPCLLHFLTQKNLHFNFNYHKIKFNDEEVEKYFHDANVPMIINKEILAYSKKYVSFPVFYQLQFIFNAFERLETPSHRIIEIIAGVFFELKKIEVPKFSEIALSIKAKNNSIRYQKQMRSKYHMNDRNEDDKTFIKKVENDEIIKPKTFNEMNDANSIEEMKNKIKLNDSNNNDFVLPKVFDIIWNESDPNYLNDNGIIYNKTENQKNKKESQTNWMNEITNIQKDIKKRERKTLMQTKDTQIIKQSFNFNRRKSGYEPKLYKLYTYDEKDNKWIFNEDTFKQFANEKKIDIDSSKSPLILFLDSNEDDVKTINSNFINSLYPNLDRDNSDEIFVYALCDRSLNMLNFIVDFHSSEKASIKPIFLILHIPQNKKCIYSISLIVTQIYSFLSLICDFNVVILNKNHYLDQVEFVKLIQKINGKYSKNSIENDTPFSFTFQNHSSLIEDKRYFDKNFDFTNKNPKYVFLINDQTVQFDEKIDEKLNKNEFFKNLLFQFNKETYLHYINVNDSDTYEYFLTTMNDIIMNKCSTFSEIKEILTKIEYSAFSEVYFRTMFENDDDDDSDSILEKALSEHIKNKEKPIERKLNDIVRKNDVDFICKIFGIQKLIELKYSNKELKKILKENLQLLSDSHFSFINKTIGQRSFWKYQQMANIVNSHKNFLKNEYSKMIRSLIDDDSIEIIFELYFNLVENQLIKDKDRIMQVLNPFIEKIKIKNCTKVHDLRNTIKEGTNYAMKETENLREIKVTVQINKDLKSEIPQDF